MKFNIDFYYEEKYLPTKRHKNLRRRYVKSSADVEVKELTENEFPVAFVVHTLDYVYTEDEVCSELQVVSSEIRTFAGNLYKAILFSEVSSRKAGWMPPAFFSKFLWGHVPTFKFGEDFTENSLIVSSDRDEELAALQGMADQYLLYDDKIWKQCREPIYVVQTFGLGCNHGSTALFVRNAHNDDETSGECYFNALQRDQAIAYGKQLAKERGDTNSIERIRCGDSIDVLMPEMVKCDPQKEWRKQTVVKKCDAFFVSFSDFELIIRDYLDDDGAELIRDGLPIHCYSTRTHKFYDEDELLDAFSHHVQVKSLLAHPLYDTEQIYFIERQE